MATYDEALKLWATSRLRAAGYEVTNPDEVSVSFEFDSGGGCDTCGSSPSAEVVIRGPGWVSVSIEPDEFDFATVLGEIVAAGGGSLTA